MAKIDETNEDKVLSSTISMFNMNKTLENGYSTRLTNEATDRLYVNSAIKLAASKRVLSRDCSSGKYSVDDHDNGQNSDVDVIFEKCEVLPGLVYNGKIHYNSVIDEKHMDATFINFKISIEDKEIFFEKANLKLDDNYNYVKLTGYTKDGNKSSKFKDFVIEESNTTEKILINANGALSTSCINNEWIDINTTKKIEQNLTKNCPDAGVVEVKGKDSNLKLEYKSDESIDIYLDGNLSKTYSSCEEMAADAGSECSK